MYWYKRRNAIAAMAAAIMCASFFIGCKPDVKLGAGARYFDLAGYFAKESARYGRQNKPVFKTVMHNGTTEGKQVRIADWAAELNLFAAADINKPAWKDSYSIINEDSILIYKAKSPELKVREILIRKQQDKVKWILIFNQTKNALYQTTEKLSYFPDSLYWIERKQSVRLIGTNFYRIKGEIKK